MSCDPEFIKFEEAYRTFTEEEKFSKLVAIDEISSIAYFGEDSLIHVKLRDGEDFFVNGDMEIIDGILVPHVIKAEDDE